MKDLFLDIRDQTHKNYTAVRDSLADGVCLYGLGFVGRWAFNFLTSQGASFNFIIDNDPAKQDDSINGVPIIGRDQADFSNVSSIIVGSRHAAKSIINSLDGVKLPIISIDSFIVHLYGESHIPLLERLLLHDQQSLETLYAVLLSMLTGDTSYLARVVCASPLFSEFPFFNIYSEVYIDAGAYVGDTFERFIWSVNGIFNKAFLFEPGHNQYNAMLSRVSRLCSEWCIDRSKIICEQLVIGADNNKTYFYDAINPTQSSRYPQGDFQVAGSQIMPKVNRVALDDYFQNTKEIPTMIKVDVEGSEEDLINGARQMITAHFPKIALSIYHYPLDIFSLPVKVHNLRSDYTFRLRHHSSMLMETVLYCY